MIKFKEYSKILSHSIYPIEYKDFCKEYREKKDRYDLVWWEETPRTVIYEWVFKQKSYMKKEYKK